jgi:ferritin-like metal-binding protein YciE
MSPKEQLTKWLNDAYGMEMAQIQVLENHAKDAKDYPDIRARDEQHIEETRRQAERVKQCLELLGEKTSGVKSAIGKVMGTVQGASTGMARDELVKNFLSDFGSEQFEIACYRSLIAGAEDLGQPEIARLCRESLAEEEAMARWLHDRIPEVTRMMLHQVAHS